MLHLVNFSSSETRPDSASNAGSLKPQTKRRNRRRRRMNSKQKIEPVQKEQHSNKVHDAPMTKNDLYFALDCEMVGIGPDGLDSAVARVTVINWEKEVVLDTYVKVPVPVTDYRAHVSGIKPEDIHSNDAMTFQETRAAVEKILRGKILIGHGLDNDLYSLGLTHPWCDVRDTALYAPYMREIVDYDNGKVMLRPRKLRDLTWEKLGLQIQDDGKPHSPIEDAGAAMDLYKASRQEWEEELRRQQALQFKQVAEQVAEQPKPRSAFSSSFLSPPIPNPTFGQDMEVTPYQICYDAPIYKGFVGPQVPVSLPPPGPVEPRRQLPRRWFSRDTSPEKNREKKEQDDVVTALPLRPASPRSSGLFSSFRRSSGLKRVVQQATSTDTDTTIGSDGDKMELGGLEYNSEGLEWLQVDEAHWQPPQTKRQSSRLFAYLSLGRTECNDDEIMKIYEDNEEQQNDSQEQQNDSQEQQLEWKPCWDGDR